jgi:hypothetical protein
MLNYNVGAQQGNLSMVSPILLPPAASAPFLAMTGVCNNPRQALLVIRASCHWRVFFGVGLTLPSKKITYFDESGGKVHRDDIDSGNRRSAGVEPDLSTGAGLTGAAVIDSARCGDCGQVREGDR